MLRGLLRTGSPRERAGAVRALPSVPGPEGIATWLARLDPARDEDERVLAAAVEARRSARRDAALAERARRARGTRGSRAARRALALEALGGMGRPRRGRRLFLAAAGGGRAVEGVPRARRSGAAGARGGPAAPRPARPRRPLAARPRVGGPDADHGAGAAARRARRGRRGGRRTGRRRSPPAAAGPGERRTDDAAPPPAHVPRFYGIPIERGAKSQVVFCLDVEPEHVRRGLERARRELHAR